MCGIAGYWGELPADAAKAVLENMNATLAHRGPDGESIWVGPGLGLAHRRLAIIDLTGGAQPMSSADGRYRIVFNGEIYNHKELRHELMLAGYKFQTRSDTEVIAPALDHWGIRDGLRKLRGMFAFALFDENKHTLLLARDRVGIKPLYLATASGLVLFASEPKALLNTPFLEPRLDATALLDFFTLGQAIAPRTCFSAIRELRPGTWLRLNAHGESSGCYWEWCDSTPKDWTGADPVEALEACLTSSVRAHLESDVPLAAFLSGGIDSSVLVWLLSRRLGIGIATFNMGFDDMRYDESLHARAVAAHCASNHRELRIQSGEGDPDLVKTILEQYDQPFGDSSNIPTWLICREMSRYYKVAISGDGGDEMFGGYPRYQTARDIATLSKIPAGPALLKAISKLLSTIIPDRSRQWRKASEFARLPRLEMLCALCTYFRADELSALVRPEFAQAATAEGPTWCRLTETIRADGSDPAAQLIDMEVRWRLHADYLRKVDIASSAHGLEVRTPYLDPEVFQFAEQLPIRLKVRRRTPKHLLRTLALNALPATIVNRPKHGFDIPFDHWSGRRMNEFLSELLLSSSSRSRVVLLPGCVEALFAAFRGSGKRQELSRYQVYQRIFMLASLELWLRKWSPSLS
jgi:asparagine synthase (glutamine-hydrolysing)